jgi:ABC-type branched-subunit amino acid transport system substrate-binding protein
MHMPSFAVETLRALCEKYGWTKIGLVYALNTNGISVRHQLEQIPGLDAHMLAVRVDEFDSEVEAEEAHLTALDLLMRESLNVIFVSLPEESKQMLNLISDASKAGMFGEGRAWVFLPQTFNWTSGTTALSASCPEPVSATCVEVSSPCAMGKQEVQKYPDWSLLLKKIDAFPSNRTQLLSTILSLSPTTYPGTGPGSKLQRGSVQVVDGINVIAKAIETILDASSTVTRSLLNHTLVHMDADGMSGRIRFTRDAGGVWMRKEQNSEICSFNGTSHKTEEAMWYHGATNGGMEERKQVVWPGETMEIPDDEVDFIQIGAIWSFTSSAIPEIAKEWMKNTLRYGAHWINENSDKYLPEKTKLNLVVYDDFASTGLAAKYALETSRRGFSVILGGLTPAQTIALQGVLSGFNVPQISTGVTSTALSNKFLYPTFMRTVPSSAVSAATMIELAKLWGWNDGIVVISSIDSSGNSVAEVVLDKAISEGITIGHHFVLQPNLPNYDAEAAEITAYQPRVVFFLVSYDTSIPLMRSLYKSGFKPNAALLIEFLPPGIPLTQYALSAGTSVDFYQGWLVLGSASGTGPQWQTLLANTSDLVYSDWPGVGFLTPFVPTNYDAFIVIADSVKRLKEGSGKRYGQLSDSREGFGSESQYRKSSHVIGDHRNGTEMLASLKAFDGDVFTGHITFNANGDPKTAFDLVNIRGDESRSVGRWSEEGVLNMFSGEQIIWPDGTTNIPLSVLPRNETWLKWNSGGGAALSVFAGLGMLLCVVLLITFFIFRNAPVIKSSTWQFLVVMAIGSMLGFGSTWVWIGRPTEWICALRIWIPPIAFVLIIAPLLAKTWRLHKIFTLTDMRIKPIPLILLVEIVLVLVGFQVLLCIFWISFGTIKPIVVNDPADRTLAYVLCGSNRNNKILSYITYGYLGLLLVLGAFLAFKVRKLPKDFNESKWIARTIYNSLLFAAMIIILGYSLSKYYIVVLILIAVCTLAISFGSVTLMMAPKLWALYRHPERRSATPKGRSGGSTEMRTGSRKAPQ